MSWCNVLQRAARVFFVNYIFPGAFGDFRLNIFTQEKISIYVDPCP